MISDCDLIISDSGRHAMEPRRQRHDQSGCHPRGGRHPAARRTAAARRCIGHRPKASAPNSRPATNQEAIRQVGAVPQLVALLYAGEASEATQQAAGALRNLAANNSENNSENKEAVREAGGIAPLVALLSAGPESLCAQKAAGALRNLAASNSPNQSRGGTSAAGGAASRRPSLDRCSSERRCPRQPLRGQSGQQGGGARRARRHRAALRTPPTRF